MDILVLMEVAYQMAKFGDNYKLKEYITITIYAIKYFLSIVVEAKKNYFHKLNSSAFQLYTLFEKGFWPFQATRPKLAMHQCNTSINVFIIPSMQ